MKEVIKLFEPEMPPVIEGNFTQEEMAHIRTDPDKLTTVLTQVTLNRGELVPEDVHYLTMWNMFFVHRDWFYHRNNGHKLAELFPAFAALEMQNPFTRPEDPAKLEKFHQLEHLFNSCLLVLPFKAVAATNGGKAEVRFIGAKFNHNSTNRNGYALVNRNTRLHAVCAYGYFQAVNTAGHASATISNLASGRYTYHFNFGTARRGTEISTRDRKILNIFQAVEDALLVEEMDDARKVA